MKRLPLILTMSLASILLIATFLLSNSLEADPLRKGLRTQQDAIDQALWFSTTDGLIGNPQNIIAVPMVYQQYAQQVNQKSGPAINPDLRVWVVTMRGKVDTLGRLPNFGTSIKYDNLIVVMDAETGELISMQAISAEAAPLLKQLEQPLPASSGSGAYSPPPTFSSGTPSNDFETAEPDDFTPGPTATRAVTSTPTPCLGSYCP